MAEETQFAKVVRGPTDVGVDMLKGDAREPVGPEDAFGPGAKRGDYSSRIGDEQRHVAFVPNPNAGPGEPSVIAVEQNPLAGEQGEVAGRKGGVESG